METVGTRSLTTEPVGSVRVTGWPDWDDGSLLARLAGWPGLADVVLGRARLRFIDIPGHCASVETAGQQLAGLIDQAAVAGGYQPGELRETGERLAVKEPIKTWLNTNRQPKSEEVVDLSATIEMLADVRRRRNALETAEALLLEQARLQALAAEPDLVNMDRIGRRNTDAAYRGDYIETVIVSDIALALHDGHDALAKRMRAGQVLFDRGRDTLDHAIRGEVNWRNAAILADKTSALPHDVGEDVDFVIAEFACTDTPGQFQARLRRVIDSIHPTPIQVRHEEAATKRHVTIEPATDGMGYLTLFAPDVALHAIWDRVHTTARHLRDGGEQRTLAQLRADVTIALLLDDGTTDLQAASQVQADGEAEVGRAGIVPPRTPSTGYITSEHDSGVEPVIPTAPPETPDSDESVPRVAELVTVPVVPPPHWVVEPVTVPMAPPAAVATQLSGPGEQPGSEPPSLVPESSDPPPIADSPPAMGPASRFSLAQLARSIRPKVFVTIPVLTLLGKCDAPAMLDGTVPIDPETTIELAGLAPSLTRLLTDPYTGNVLAVDEKTYRPPAQLRQWIQLRDATCRFPGCTRRAVEGELDHTSEYATGGTTSAVNLASLCRRHHMLKSIGAYRAEQVSPSSPCGQSAAVSGGSIAGGPGTLLWTSPTNRQYTSQPEPIPVAMPVLEPNAANHEPDPYDDLGDPPF